MATMTEEIKSRLRERAKLKRIENPIPKDRTPMQWAVSTDFAQESSPEESDYEPGYGLRRAYFRYVPPNLLAILAEHLPHTKARIPAPTSSGYRPVIVFDLYQVRAVLEFLGLDRGKYSRQISGSRVFPV